MTSIVLCREVFLISEVNLHKEGAIIGTFVLCTEVVLISGPLLEVLLYAVLIAHLCACGSNVKTICMVQVTEPCGERGRGSSGCVARWGWGQGIPPPAPQP